MAPAAKTPGSSSVNPNPRGRGGLPLLLQLFAGVVGGELPAGSHGDGLAAQFADALSHLVRPAGRKLRHEHLGGAEAGDLVDYLPF